MADMIPGDYGCEFPPIEQPRPARNVAPGIRVGQVVEHVSWDGKSKTGRIVVRGNADKIPKAGSGVVFGKTLAGRIIQRRANTGKLPVPGEGQDTDQLILTVSCDSLPSIGARVLTA